MDSDESVSYRHRPSSSAELHNLNQDEYKAEAEERYYSQERTKRIRERSSEGERRQVSHQNSRKEADHSSRASDRTRQKKKKRRSSEAAAIPNETPITAVLQELKEDIEEGGAASHFDSPKQGAGDDDSYGFVKNRDHVYVEHLGGFSTVSRSHALGAQGSRHNGTAASGAASALDMAIIAQKGWSPLADFCHGLLAGIAIMQAILVDNLLDSMPENVSKFVAIYSSFSLIYTTVFYLLISVCLISVLDRLDLTNSDWPYLLDLLSVRPQFSWLLVPLYTGGLLLTLGTARSDDWIHLSQFRVVLHNSSEAVIQGDPQSMRSWHILNSLRCICVVLGWLVMATSRPKDQLLKRLIGMRYQQNAKVSSVDS